VSDSFYLIICLVLEVDTDVSEEYVASICMALNLVHTSKCCILRRLIVVKTWRLTILKQ